MTSAAPTGRTETVASIVAIAAVISLQLYSCSTSSFSEADLVGTYQAEAKGEYVHAAMVTARNGSSEYRELKEQRPDRLRAILIVKPDGTWELNQEVPVQSRHAGTWSLWPILSFHEFPSRLPIKEERSHPPVQLWWPKTARLYSGPVVSLCVALGPCFKRIKQPA